MHTDNQQQLNEIQQLQNQSQQQQRMIDQQQNEIQQQNNDIQQLQAENQQQQNAIQRQQNDTENLKTLNQQLQNQTLQQDSVIQQLQSTYQQHVSDINLLKTQAQNFQHSIQLLQNEYQIQESAFHHFQSNVNSDISSLQNHLQHADGSISFRVEANNRLYVTDGVHVHFDRVVTNIGNGYDGISNEFVVPVSGFYVFSFEIKNNFHGDPQLRTDSDHTLTSNTIVHLNARESVYLQAIIMSSFVTTATYGQGSYFLGFLVHAD